MYIKEIKTRNTKTKREYVKHALVEAVRTESGPRQRTVMQLGVLTLPKELWPLLIAELEKRISGQIELTLPGVKLPLKVKNAADRAMERFTIRRAKRIEKRKSPDPDEVTINLGETATSKHRSLGAEFVCHSIWNELKMPKKLEALGFGARERSLAEAVVTGRLMDSGSELSTWEWMKNSSAIGDLTEESLDNIGLNSVYKIGDKLLSNKEDIEKHLFETEAKLHPGREMLYLFDITNFYFEGQALGNSLAQYGKSKEKRDDCPLVSLGLIIDSSGFPVISEVFPGNIGEPHTLSEILSKMGYFEVYLPGMSPPIVMDRGIATKDNIALLKEKNISYILISRGPRNAHYLEEFENHPTDPAFKSITKNNREIRLKEVRCDNAITEILCISEGRKEKEDAIERRWKERASEDLSSLQRSIRKGNIILTSKIQRKLGRLEERYPSLNKYFAIELVEDKINLLTSSDLIFCEKSVFDIEKDESNPLNGTYVIETTLQEKSPEEIWSLYMTMTRVEEAFRCLKCELGTRPVYHKIARRTKGHLFISILAYHLLINIEYKLSSAGDTRRWSSIRKILKTHQRATIIITDTNQQIHHLRITSQAEPCHSQIYHLLKIKPGKDLKKYIVAKRL
jgi:transposase